MISLYIGPMWGGKTTEVFQHLRKARRAGRPTVMYKYLKDTRHALASSHDGDTEAATPVTSLETTDLPSEAGTTIGIDEGQFIKGLATFCRRAAASGHHVHVAALDGDYEQRMFDEVVALIPWCDEVIKLRAMCFECRAADALFTQRIVQNGERELIGGKDYYKAVCRGCLLLKK